MIISNIKYTAIPTLANLLWTGGGSGLLAENSESLKFDPQNGHFNALTSGYGALKLDSGNIGTLFGIGSDGVFYTAVELPEESYFENKTYNLFGGAFQAGKSIHIAYRGSAYYAAAEKNTFRVTVRGSSGAIVKINSAVVTDRRVLLAITKVGDTFSVKTVNCETGAVTDGESQVSADTHCNAPQDFWVGYAAAAATVPAVPMTGNGSMFTGSIESFGYADVTPTDQMLSDYALGGSVDNTFGLANIRFSRRLRGTDAASLAAEPGTADATPPLTLVGSLFASGGSVRRSSLTKHITLVDKWEGYVAGIFEGSTLGTLPISGTSSEVSGTVQARIVWDDDATSSAWVDIGTIQGDGSWSGDLIAQKMSTWGFIEVRLKDDAAIQCISRKRVAFGYKIYFPNQSQCRIMALDADLGNTLPVGVKGSVFKLGSVTAATLQSYVFTDTFANSDGLCSMIEYLHGFVGCPVGIVSDAISGSSSQSWSDTEDLTRDWADTVAILGKSGNDVSAIVWQWGSSDNVGSAYGEVFDALYDGTGPRAEEHNLNDGTFKAGFKFAVSPFSRSTTNGGGPFDFDSNAVGATRQAQVDWVEANPDKAVLGPYVNDMAIDGTGPHQPTGDIKGSTRIALRMAEAAARALGLSSLSNPEITSLVLTDSTTITGTVTLPNGGAIKTDGPAVLAGFEISTDGGSTWSRSGFVGAIVDGTTFTLNKDSGSWSAGTQVRYQHGSPLGYGSSVEGSRLYEGCLYDGAAFDGGLGLPVAPLEAVAL